MGKRNNGSISGRNRLLLATGIASITELAVRAGIAAEVKKLVLPPSAASRQAMGTFEREALSIEESCWREYCWSVAGDEVAESRIAARLDRFYRGWLDRLPLK